MQTLDTINLMLATLAERPLVSLSDTHALLPAALACLDNTNRLIQADGWWFNMEDLTLAASASDQSFYLPNDCLDLRCATYNLVARGNRVYNLTGGTFTFTDTTLDIQLIRYVSFEDMPEVAAQFVAASAILKFQADYDGDVAKARTLSKDVETTKVAINSAHTRGRKSNFIDSNVRLQRLKSFTRRVRCGY